MTVFALILVLCFLGAILWLVNVKLTTLNSTLKWIINAVIIIIAVVIVLQAFGVWDELRGIRVPKI